MKYSEIECEISPQLVAATRWLISRKEYSIWKQPETEQNRRIDVWAGEVSMQYGIEKPTVVIDKSFSPSYTPWEHKIRLNKVSVVSLFHEFAHAIQVRTGKPKMESEVWARTFSCKLFKTASPLNYRRACERKTLLFTLDDEVRA